MFQETKKDGELAKTNCDRNLLKAKPEPTLFVNTLRSCIIIPAEAEGKFSSERVIHDRGITC